MAVGALPEISAGNLISHWHLSCFAFLPAELGCLTYRGLCMSPSCHGILSLQNCIIIDNIIMIVIVIIKIIFKVQVRKYMCCPILKPADYSHSKC